MALPRPYDPNDPYAQQPMRAPLPYAPMPGREPLGSGFAVQPPTPAPEPAQLPPEQMPPEPPIRGAASPADVGGDEKARLAETMNDPAFGDYVTANQKPDKGWQVLDALFSGLQGKQYDQGYWQQNAKQFDDANLKDPHSEESHKLRQANAPMLQQLGLQPDEIAHLSGADIANVSKGGDLVTGLLTARQKAQQAKVVEAERLRQEQLKHDEAIAAEGRKALHDKEMADYTGNTPETKKDIAALQGGIIGQREVNQAILGNNLAMNRELTMADRAEKARIDAENRQHAYDAAHPKAGQGEPLRVEDLEGTGWSVRDPESATRIINKRALTKQTLTQLADARTALESFDQAIANREKNGSDPLRWDQSVTEDNDLQMATAKQNYINAMGMPNTDSSQKEVAHLFPDANAVAGKGVGGVVQGFGATVGLAKDPVLEEIKAARAEAAHNLTSKIPIPSLEYTGGGKYKHGSAASAPKTASKAPTKAAPTAGLVHVRFKDGTEHDLPPAVAQMAREAGDAI